VESGFDRSRTGRLDGITAWPSDDPCAWLWPIHQPNSAPTRWSTASGPRARPAAGRRRGWSRERRASMSWRVALRRRGVVIAGSRMKSAARARMRHREERPFFTNIRRGPINLGRDGVGEPMDCGLQSRSEAGGPPSRAYRMRSGNPGAVADNATNDVRLFRHQDQTLERRGPRIEGIRQPEAKTHETLKSKRSAISPKPPTARTSAHNLVRLRRLGAVKGAPCASPRRASPLDAPEPPEKNGLP